MADEEYINLTHQSRRENPMASSKNKMKLAVFSLNTDGGMAVTKAPERLHGDDWVRNLAVAQKADRSGFEAIIASGRWKGFGGERNSGGITYETYAWAAGLAALTKRVGIVTTSHLTTVHPVFAAKQAATIDHISGGRFGLNILVGWNIPEMLMFNNSVLEHEERYDYADEWIEVIMRAWSDKNPFDFKGSYFDLKQVISEPKPLNKPYLINAGSSPRGKQFCMEHCDAAFLRVKHLDGDEVVKHQINAYKDFARRELNKDLKIWCYGYVVQGDTEKEAFDYLDYYVNKMGDNDEANAVMKELGFKNYDLSKKEWATYLFQFKAGFLGVPLIGTPDKITKQFQHYSNLGIDGIALGWLDYHAGINEFCEKVLPRMEEMELRRPFRNDV